MKALILAAGGGKNMAPFSKTRPKALIHVAGRPILGRSLMLLKESGFGEVNLVTGPGGSTIEECFGTGKSLGININYILQKKPAGIGNAILAAQKRFNPGEHFLLIYADTVADHNMFSCVMQTFGITGQAAAAICLSTNSSSLGNVYLDNSMNITSILEKPARKDLGNYVLAGVYILPYTFFSLLKKSKGDMAKALGYLVSRETMKASIWEKGWLDIGRPWDILTANRMIMDTWHTSSVHQSVVVKDAKIKGPVHIEEDVEIRSGAVIEGPSFIGRGSYIGNNVLIRKYSSLGPESTVGYGVEMKNCILFGRSHVGRLSFVGDSVVGESVDIGSGTMTINGNLDRSEIKVKINGKMVPSKMNKLGAFIGDGAILGCGHNIKAGSIIDPGKVIPHHHTYPRER